MIQPIILDLDAVVWHNLQIEAREDLKTKTTTYPDEVDIYPVTPENWKKELGFLER